jgi:hypothetical protein
MNMKPVCQNVSGVWDTSAVARNNSRISGLSDTAADTILALSETIQELSDTCTGIMGIWDTADAATKMFWKR